MALFSFVESAPRAYRLKASNAASPISTSIGTIPSWLALRPILTAFLHYRHNCSIALCGELLLKTARSDRATHEPIPILDKSVGFKTPPSNVYWLAVSITVLP
jgi:hypothetical protein